MARHRKAPAEHQQRPALPGARSPTREANTGTRQFPTPHQRSPRADLFSLVLIAFVALVAYSNTFSVPFTFDDRPGIVFNEEIQDLRFLRRILLSDVAGEARPLVNLSFALNYAVGKLNPFGYHLVNLLLHVVAGILVYRTVGVLVSLFAPALQVNATALPNISLLTALLFVSHPVQTEAVTYVWGRSDVLSTVFYLLSVYCFLRAYHGREASSPQFFSVPRLAPPQTRQERRSYWGAVVAFALALSTKATVLTLPPLLLILDMYLLAPQPGESRWAVLTRRHLPFLCLAGLRVYWYYVVAQQPELEYAFRHRDAWNERLAFLPNVLTQCQAIGKYLSLLFLPINLNLDHHLPAVRSLVSLPAVTAVGLCGALMGLGVFWRARFPLGSFLLWWFLGTLSFYFLFPLPDFLVERRLYLPSVAFCAGLALAVHLLGKRIASRWPMRTQVIWGTRVTLLGVVLVFTVLTLQRNEVWRDPHALWSDTVTKSPEKVRPQSNLAIVSLEQKKYTEAIIAAQKALALNPATAEAHYSLLDAYMGQGEWRKAEAQFLSTLRQYPYYAVEWYSWTHAKLPAQGNPFLKAFSTFDQELTTQPGNADGHVALGFLYASLLHDEPRALRHLEEGLKGNPTHFRRAVVLRAVQDLRRKLDKQ